MQRYIVAKRYIVKSSMESISKKLLFQGVRKRAGFSLNPQHFHTRIEGIGVNIQDLGGTAGPGYFPVCLFQNIEDMVSLNILQAEQ